MEPNEHAVKLLNSLIETTLDSANGYREAAEHVKDPQLRTLFSERAGQRQKITAELQGEVRSFGGEPRTEQSMIGKAANAFAGLKGAITGGSAKAVIDEVERGEDVIKDKFAKATQDADLPAQARPVVERAYGSIKADHDQISRLKHELH